MMFRAVVCVLLLSASLVNDAKAWQQCPNNPDLLYERRQLIGVSYWLIPIGKNSGRINLSKSLDKIGRDPNYIGTGDVFCDFTYNPVRCEDKTGQTVAMGNYLPEFKSKDKGDWEYERETFNGVRRDAVKIMCPTSDLNVSILWDQRLFGLTASKNGQTVNTNFLLYESVMYGLNIKKRERFGGF